jgi:hypothetical protein
VCARWSWVSRWVFCWTVSCLSFVADLLSCLSFVPDLFTGVPRVFVSRTVFFLCSGFLYGSFLLLGLVWFHVLYPAS